jgi:N-acetylglucosaminyl-diphospho-decaprenol L-rhamnosyltransferase
MTGNAIVGLILHYRDAVRTSTCLRSLISDGVAHVLVWDNSEDGGVSIGELKRLMCGERRYQTSEAGHNLGFAAGVNRGLEVLSGQFPGSSVLLINNDAILLPGALGAFREVLDSNPSAVILYPNIDHGGWVRGTVFYHRLTGLITDRYLPGSFPYASGCCLLINLAKSGALLFDEDFFMYGEDIALGARLSRCDGAMVHVQKLLVQHEGSASSQMGSLFYETRVVAAQLILASKLSKGRLDRFLVMVLHGIWLCMRSLTRSLRFRSQAPLRALREGKRIAKELDCSQSSI